MSAIEQHERRLRAIGCLLCRRLEAVNMEPELHHVAEGSGLRSPWAQAPLCAEHHRGKHGLHGMGTKAFIRLYRPPGDSEYGLLVWTIEDLLARFGDA